MKKHYIFFIASLYSCTTCCSEQVSSKQSLEKIARVLRYDIPRAFFMLLSPAEYEFLQPYQEEIIKKFTKENPTDKPKKVINK
jgi:hypothetical protein